MSDVACIRIPSEKQYADYLVIGIYLFYQSTLIKYIVFKILRCDLQFQALCAPPPFFVIIVVNNVRFIIFLFAIVDVKSF